ncbi:TPA: carbohydrate kinase family protein [Escherichia coli]|nr:carbohydrate kinase family protein [Escherichia coli]
MKKFDVAALGSGNIDIFLSIPSLPTRGGKVVGTRLGEQAGGTVANSACAMGQLGLNVVSVSCVGNDHSASIILDGFKKYHVNCDFVQVIPELIANTASFKVGYKMGSWIPYMSIADYKGVDKTSSNRQIRWRWGLTYTF